jgi:hypothetical protein
MSEEKEGIWQILSWIPPKLRPWIGILFVIGIVVYFFKDVIFKKEENAPTKIQNINLSGQFLIKGKPQSYYQIDIPEYEYIKTKTDLDGKFEFVGIPTSEIEKVIHLRVKCNGEYIQIEGLDLANRAKFPIKDKRIYLGLIELEKEPCKSDIQSDKKLQEKSDKIGRKQYENHKIEPINTSSNEKFEVRIQLKEDDSKEVKKILIDNEVTAPQINSTQFNPILLVSSKPNKYQTILIISNKNDTCEITRIFDIKDKDKYFRIQPTCY